jgi:disulfide bond formation protein DsbB
MRCCPGVDPSRVAGVLCTVRDGRKEKKGPKVNEEMSGKWVDVPGLRLAERRAAWIALAGTAFAIEAAALWFQHGMGLDPCVMCIYERLAIIGLVAAGLIGAVRPALAIVRWVGYLVWGISAAWGLRLALEHIGIQTDKSAALACSFSPDFPAWLRLDEWLPAMFLPTGFCDDIQWSWLSLTMVEWVAVVFTLYLLVLAVIVYLELRGSRSL